MSDSKYFHSSATIEKVDQFEGAIKTAALKHQDYFEGEDCISNYYMILIGNPMKIMWLPITPELPKYIRVEIEKAVSDESID